MGGAIGDKFLIRKDIDAYMADLKRWLLEAEEVKLEEMTGFFAARVDQYEEHMAIWKKAYRHMGMLVPKGIQTLLDLGCGTGLELEDILCSQPGLHVTGIDLSSDMLGKLQEKFPQVKTICADYFSCELGEKTFDAAVSFETLHHFKPEKKKLLMDFCSRKRAQQRIQENVFIHFDTLLTAEHEMELMRCAGFGCVEWGGCIEGAAFLTATAEESK